MGDFDLDLNFGEIFEGKVSDIFTKGKIEVKTGNIAIEMRYKGKPSGISTTEADTWIHLLSHNGRIVGGFIIPVKNLRTRLKLMLHDGSAKVVHGGDCDESQLILAPISCILKGEYEKY